LNHPFFEVENLSSLKKPVYLCKKSILLKSSTYLLILTAYLTIGCNKKTTHTRADFMQDSIALMSLIRKGNDIYATKSGFSAYTISMLYYDSAWKIAQKPQNNLLLCVTYFAKGRAYDAWNNEPQKILQYYKLAEECYSKMPTKFEKALYLKHLVAHSYDKARDTTNCIATLAELYNTILPLPDSTKKKLNFISELALISTKVNNYTLADSILNNLTKRKWIKNDPESIDYLNHYYLTKSRIDVYGNRNTTTKYLDSLAQAYKNCKNMSDSNYYSDELRNLYGQTNNTKQKLYFETEYNKLFVKQNSNKSIAESQKKLDAIEIADREKEIEQVKKNLQIRKYITWALIIFAMIICSLLYFLYQRNIQIRKNRNELYEANKSLEQKSIQNEMLNKEIHHRVKNNLQMIMSLVKMQERNSETDDVKQNMQNIRLRIESIANLHEQLMEHCDTVDLSNYIQKLVSNVSDILTDNKTIINNLQIAPIKVSQKISFPLGLIINEWITNSVKYANTNDKPLEICIEITNGNKQIKVNYKDNGELPSSKISANTLGLNIIQLLSAQLNATLTKNNNNPFIYHLIIPIS
jgi:two-component sensor histidine kinase